MATLSAPVPAPPPADDCEQLHKALSGWGTNEGAITSILAHRTAADRRLIRDVYLQTYGGDLLDALRKDLTRHFERAVVLWTLGPAERDAEVAGEAIRKWSSGDRTAIEVACARSPNELIAAKREYHERFKRSLEEDVAAHTSGDFRKLLVPLVGSYRYDGAEVDASLASSEAQSLHEKISCKAYNDDEVIRILTTRSRAQLFATFEDYNHQFGNPINKDLKSDPNDEFLAALRAIIKCIASPEVYFEKIIRLALNKVGTDEGVLTRVITTRAEVDMKLIKEQYLKKNNAALESAIKLDARGDYENFLLSLIADDEA